MNSRGTPARLTLGLIMLLILATAVDLTARSAVVRGFLQGQTSFTSLLAPPFGRPWQAHDALLKAFDTVVISLALIGGWTFIPPVPRWRQIGF